MKKYLSIFILVSLAFSNDYSILFTKQFISTPGEFEAGISRVGKTGDEDTHKYYMNFRYGLTPNLEIVYPGIKYRFLHTPNDEAAVMLKLNEYGEDTLDDTIYRVEGGLLNRYHLDESLILDVAVLYEHKFAEIYKDDYNYKFLINPAWDYRPNIRIGIRGVFSEAYSFEKDAIDTIWEMYQKNSQIGPMLSYYFDNDVDVSIGYSAQNKTYRIKENGAAREYETYINNYILDVRWRF